MRELRLVSQVLEQRVVLQIRVGAIVFLDGTGNGTQASFWLATIPEQSAIRIPAFRVRLDHDCRHEGIRGALKLIGMFRNKTGL